MARTGTNIAVIGKVGDIPDLRAQLSTIAKKKGTSIPEVAEKLGVSKQRLYSLLGAEKITEDQLSRVLEVMESDLTDLHLGELAS